MKWKEFFILFVLGVIAIDFLSLGDRFPYNIFRSDHNFHIIKFKLFSDEGFSNYEELGNIPAKLLFPPFLVPFLFLSKILPVNLAYLLTYFLLIGLAYFLAKKIIPKKENFYLTCILFPLSIFIFFRVGRLLELMAHLSLFLLYLYLDEKNKNQFFILGLFIFGLTSHLPTALFYAPMLSFKSFEKKEYRNVFHWFLLGIIWASLYFQQIYGSTGIVYSRMEMINEGVRDLLNSKNLSWIIGLLQIFMLYLLSSLPFFGKEGLYAFPSFLATLLPTELYLNGISIYKYLPGINQILVTAPVIFFSYLLLKNNPKWWKIMTALTFIVTIIPISWQGNESKDLPFLDKIEGNYTTALFSQYEGVLMIHNYLAFNGKESPLCSTWEYSKPEWYHFSPQTCEDLNIGVNYIILPKRTEWAKECGEYTESPNLLIVKVL